MIFPSSFFLKKTLNLFLFFSKLMFVLFFVFFLVEFLFLLFVLSKDINDVSVDLTINNEKKQKKLIPLFNTQVLGALDYYNEYTTIIRVDNHDELNGFDLFLFLNLLLYKTKLEERKYDEIKNIIILKYINENHFNFIFVWFDRKEKKTKAFFFDSFFCCSKKIRDYFKNSSLEVYDRTISSRKGFATIKKEGGLFSFIVESLHRCFRTYKHKKGKTEENLKFDDNERKEFLNSHMNDELEVDLIEEWQRYTKNTDIKKTDNFFFAALEYFCGIKSEKDFKGNTKKLIQTDYISCGHHSIAGVNRINFLIKEGKNIEEIKEEMEKFSLSFEEKMTIQKNVSDNGSIMMGAYFQKYGVA